MCNQISHGYGFSIRFLLAYIDSEGLKVRIVKDR